MSGKALLAAWTLASSTLPHLRPHEREGPPRGFDPRIGIQRQQRGEERVHEGVKVAWKQRLGPAVEVLTGTPAGIWVGGGSGCTVGVEGTQHEGGRGEEDQIRAEHSK